MRISILVLSALFLSLTTYAGNERGNGGDVVICKNEKGEIISSEILDIYEGKTMRNIIPQLGSPSLSLEKKLEVLTNRLKEISPLLSSFVKNEYAKFWEEAQFLDNVILEDIPDSDHLYIPKGCEIQQIAIQRKPDFEGDKRYIVSNDLWKILNNENKLALILHEVIYKIAIENWHENSRKTRLLNAILLSDKIKDYQGIKFAELVTQLRIVNSSFTYLYAGHEFKVSDYNSNALSIGGELLEPIDLEVFNNKLKVSRIYFYNENFGQGLYAIMIAPGHQSIFEVETASGVSVHANVCSYMGYYITFSPNGSLKSLHACERPQNSYVKVNNQSINFAGHIQFTEQGDISSINAKSPYLHFYLNNWIPIYGWLSFYSGILYTEYIYAYQTFNLNIGGVTFTVEKNSRILMSLFGELTFISIKGHSSAVKLAPQINNFKCSSPLSFHLNSSLKKCMIAIDGSGIGLKTKTGDTITARQGDLVTFDEDGFLLN